MGEFGFQQYLGWILILSSIVISVFLGASNANFFVAVGFCTFLMSIGIIILCHGEGELKFL
jgi:type IV secretory pathway TrbL component